MARVDDANYIYPDIPSAPFTFLFLPLLSLCGDFLVEILLSLKPGMFKPQSTDFRDMGIKFVKAVLPSCLIIRGAQRSRQD